jgi:hypothetical protein
MFGLNTACLVRVFNAGKLAWVAPADTLAVFLRVHSFTKLKHPLTATPLINSRPWFGHPGAK